MANEIPTELKTLRLIPLKKRTKEQQKRYQALETAYSRANAKNKKLDEKLAKISDAGTTLAEFHELNRAEVDAGQLKVWLEQQERVLDQIHWMATWQDQDPNEVDYYVSLEDGLNDLERFIAEHGFIKDAYDYSSQTLRDFEPLFAVWADRKLDDSFYRRCWGGAIAAYYKDPQRLKALCEENEPTRIFALFGIMTAMREFHYLQWKADLKARQSRVKAA